MNEETPIPYIDTVTALSTAHIGNMYKVPFMYNHSTIFIPKKHTKMSYAKQNKLAKKRRVSYRNKK